jgi:hypothetical protein
MDNWIQNNWLILAAASLLVGIYISVLESFLHDKGWIYFVLAAGFGALYVWRMRKGAGRNK